MTTINHTPGPWHYERGRDKVHPFYVIGDDFDLARCANEADARLIAAAPELLEAINEVLRCADGYIGNQDMMRASWVAEILRPALAKATVAPLKLSGLMVPGYEVQLAGTPEPTDA